MLNGLAALAADELRRFAREILPPANYVAPVPEPAPVPRKVCIALLAYDARMHSRCAMSLMQSAAQLAERGWGLSYILREGDSMVARGRSLLASQFLCNPQTQDCTDLMFVDTDLSWDNDELVRLCSHPVDVVGAAYPYKSEGGDFPLRWSSAGIAEENGLWTVQATTPGFFRVSRAALLKMSRELPWLGFHDSAAPDNQSWMFFDNVMRPNGVYDEGYIFCEHWRQVGGTCYIDPDIELAHIGMKSFRHGTLRQWLERKGAETDKLIHEHPEIPPLRLAGMVMTGRKDLLDEPPKPAEVRPAEPPQVAVANEPGPEVRKLNGGAPLAAYHQHRDAGAAGTPDQHA